MALFNCYCRSNCSLAAVIAAVILGVVTAFLQITGVITATVTFLWVAGGIAAVYLLALLAATALGRRTGTECSCTALNALLVGILGTILFSLILLAVGIVATSLVSAFLVGFLVAFFALMLGASACYVRCHCQGVD